MREPIDSGGAASSIPKDEASRASEVRSVSRDASHVASERIRESNTLSDFLRWHRAKSFFFTPENIDWRWDFGGSTANDLIAEQENVDAVNKSKKNAEVVQTLKEMIDGLEPEAGMVRVGLRRVRDGEHGSYTYRVLAAYPEGSRISDPLDNPFETQEANGGVLFFEPMTPCLTHACDDLYRTHGGNDGRVVFSMPTRSIVEAMQQLQTNGQGTAEYIVTRTERGAIKQDAENFLHVGLQGGYENEPLRVRVSDFLQRQQG